MRAGRRWSVMGPLILPLGVLCGSVTGCSERARAARQGSDGWFSSATPNLAMPNLAMPDERPRMVNAELPFRYPVPLYLQRVQGNVTLRLFVDADGRVVPDSIRIVAPSGHAAFDAAALEGARQLHFQPARRRGTPIAVTLLFPVHFRHPEAPPFPGDSL